MLSNQVSTGDPSGTLKVGKPLKLIMIIIGVGTAFSVITFGITVATLVQVNKNGINSETTQTSVASTILTTVAATSTGSSPASTQTPTLSTSTPTPNSLVSMVQIEEVMDHLNELQRIADISNDTRAVNTVGFNRTLDYIEGELRSKTNFDVSKTFFYLRNFLIGANPILVTSINDTVRNRTFSLNITESEFYFIQYTRPVNLNTFTPILVIPNVGCNESDWQSVTPSPSGQIALVKRGDCTFLEKAALAARFNVSVLLLYNDGASADRFQPIFVTLGQENELPALFLSYNLGNELAVAAQNPSGNASVQISIRVRDEEVYPVGNICADTLTGNITETIVIGAHSDSVAGGPGIDDNGSGSAAILAMATALFRLFQTSTYPKYNYRVRFCWWGAEEMGLLGSQDHVNKAKVSTVVGERLSDYLINLNYDMLGSPNFMLGIYDAKTAPSSAPISALPGSNKTTDLFVKWFQQQHLPWDYTEFSGRSDYGPFLAEGIAAGGLFTGADGIKTKEQRDRYAQILGASLGGIANIIHDPCYHQICDSIGNINRFALEKTLQAAAHVLEYMGHHNDLTTWLYPERRVSQLDSNDKPKRIYHTITEYFRFPYF